MLDTNVGGMALAVYVKRNNDSHAMQGSQINVIGYVRLRHANNQRFLAIRFAGIHTRRRFGGRFWGRGRRGRRSW